MDSTAIGHTALATANSSTALGHSANASRAKCIGTR
ncbi:hypothetical protein [Candidatus Mycalebacterium sp.]